MLAMCWRTADVVVTPGNPGIPARRRRRPRRSRPTCSSSAPRHRWWTAWPTGRGAGRLVFGPGADGKRLEGSKAWMKDLLAAAGVPTARYGSFADAAAALGFLRTLPGPWVVKTDGLAAGKGVLVTGRLDEAEDDVRTKLSGSRSAMPGTVVIEEGLTGPELSAPQSATAPGRCRWRRRRTSSGRGRDTGPNTGGMGAYSPVPVAGDDVVGTVMDRFVEPTLAELCRRGIDYRGVPTRAHAHAGRAQAAGVQRALRRSRGPGGVAPARERPGRAACRGRAICAAPPPAFGPDACVTVVLASEGYPGEPRAATSSRGSMPRRRRVPPSSLPASSATATAGW